MCVFCERSKECLLMNLDDEFDKLLNEANAEEEERKKEKAKKKQEKKEKEKRKRDEIADPAPASKASNTAGKMIEIICNDRLGNKVRVKCNSEDTVGKVKTLIAAQSGHRADKIRLQKWFIFTFFQKKVLDY